MAHCAILDGRDYAIPDVCRSLAGAVLAHRLLLAPATQEGERSTIVAGRARAGAGTVSRGPGVAALGLALCLLAGAFATPALYVAGVALVVLLAR